MLVQFRHDRRKRGYYEIVAVSSGRVYLVKTRGEQKHIPFVYTVNEFLELNPAPLFFIDWSDVSDTAGITPAAHDTVRGWKRKMRAGDWWNWRYELRGVRFFRTTEEDKRRRLELNKWQEAKRTLGAIKRHLRQPDSRTAASSPAPTSRA